MLDRAAFENAVTAVARARRLDQRGHPPRRDGRAARASPLDLDRFDELSRARAGARGHPPARAVPDGGLLLRGRAARRCWRGSRDLLARATRPTVTGRTLGEEIAGARGLRRRGDPPAASEPVSAEGGLAVLRGNLAPDGAVIKHAAAEPRLLRHTGPAVVFDGLRRPRRAHRRSRRSPSTRGLRARPAQNAGPLGGPGMPEWGMLPIPQEAARAGRARHGAHLGRAHERHELRRLRAARRARVARRRPARARARRRPRSRSTCPRAG